MAIRPIVIQGDPALHRRATEVKHFDQHLRDLVADLHETNAAAHGAGLAAPQVGVSLRVFVYSLANEDGVSPRGAVVNPQLIRGKISTERADPETESEGCLSVPGEHFPLKRAEWATVHGFDEWGKPLRFDATGWFARCMQHEYDHVDGILYTDRLPARHGRKARRIARERGWGVPGLSWTPGKDPDPFGH